MSPSAGPSPSLASPHLAWHQGCQDQTPPYTTHCSPLAANNHHPHGKCRGPASENRSLLPGKEIRVMLSVLCESEAVGAEGGNWASVTVTAGCHVGLLHRPRWLGREEEGEGIWEPEEAGKQHGGHSSIHSSRPSPQSAPLRGKPVPAASRSPFPPQSTLHWPLAGRRCLQALDPPLLLHPPLSPPRSILRISVSTACAGRPGGGAQPYIW